MHRITLLLSLALLTGMLVAGCVPASAPVATTVPTAAPVPTAIPVQAVPTTVPTAVPTAAPTAAPTVVPAAAAPAKAGAIRILPENPVSRMFGSLILSVEPEDSSCEWTIDGSAAALANNTGAKVNLMSTYPGEVKVTVNCDSGTASTVVTIQ